LPKVRLTKAFCESAACEPGKKKTTYWCTATTGFILEVRPSGATYALRFIDEHNVQRQHRIGSTKDVSHAQAEKMAKRLRSEVVLGGNPAAERQKKRSVPTYGELAAEHLDYARSLKSYSSTEIALRVHILPRWAKVRLTDVTPQAVAKWLQEKDEEGLKPATVDRIRMTFGRSWELGRRFKIPGAETNPVRGIPRAKYDNKRSRYLSADEMARLLTAAEASLNPRLRDIIALLGLTGARVTELLTAELRHVDLDRRVWFIPTTKNGTARHVPLSAAAVEIIEKLPTFKDCPYLIPNPETKKPFVSIKRAWQTARRAARLNEVHLHDLRHSFASACVNSGISLLAVGKVLGHKDYKSTMRYAHLANDTLLAAVEAGAARLRASGAQK
jgi:integrase